MYGIRRKISAGAVASMAVLGFGVTTAPAAAGPGSVSRRFSQIHARGQPARTLELYLGSRFRVRVDRRSSTARWRRSQARADRARRSSARRAWRPRTAAWCASSSRPGLRLSRPLASRGLAVGSSARSETSCRPCSPRAGDRALAAIDRRSRPYSVHALRPRPGREEIAATLAAAWHEKGFTGRASRSPSSTAASRASPTARPRASCRRTSSRRTSEANSPRPASMARPWRRSSTKWLRMRSISSASAPRSISPRRRRTRRARAST